MACTWGVILCDTNDQWHLVLQPLLLDVPFGYWPASSIVYVRVSKSVSKSHELL
jgi:hypothetical protein